MQNNIPTLYILKLDSFKVKSAKISTILCLFVQNTKNVDRIAKSHKLKQLNIIFLITPCVMRKQWLFPIGKQKYKIEKQSQIHKGSKQTWLILHRFPY